MRAQSIVYEQCQSGLPVCRSCVDLEGGEGENGRARYSLWPFQGGKELPFLFSLFLSLLSCFFCPFLRPSGKKPHRSFPRRTRSFVLTSTASNKPAEIKRSRTVPVRRRCMEQGTRTFREAFRFLLVYQKRKTAVVVPLRSPGTPPSGFHRCNFSPRGSMFRNELRKYSFLQISSLSPLFPSSPSLPSCLVLASIRPLASTK